MQNTQAAQVVRWVIRTSEDAVRPYVGSSVAQTAAAQYAFRWHDELTGSASKESRQAYVGSSRAGADARVSWAGVTGGPSKHRCRQFSGESSQTNRPANTACSRLAPLRVASG
jgi:hypothetical protein